MKTGRIVCGLVALLWALAASPAAAQRVQFATPVAMQPSSAGPGTPAPTLPPPAVPAPAAPYGLAPPGPTTPAGPSPTFGPPAAAPGTLGPSTLSPTFTPPPGTVVGPAATLGPTIQPPGPTFDPYATPSSATSPLMSNDPCLPAGPAISMASMQKFLQRIDLNFQWFAGHNGDSTQQELGIDNVNLSATFAFPLLYNSETPLLVTPGFAAHYWEGPVSVLPVVPTDPPPADLPPQTFDAYLDFAWNPQVTPWFGAELNFRLGVYSDFTFFSGSSMRYMGKGMAVVTLSPSIKLKMGVWYLDRVDVKMLPAGGIVWAPPGADMYFNILFPNPKIAKRLTTWGNTEWWLYGRGDYGGGTWAITRNTGLPPSPFYPDTNGTHDVFDYNDIEVAVGLEFRSARQINGLSGYFEVGLSCDRQLIYQSGLPSAFYPTNTVFLGAGLAY